jgi:putative oxygen-independent coproporphyrinogen III oxidase
MHVYVHFPFCLAKCPYCDFTSYAKPRAEIDHRGYADAVLAELEVRGSVLEGERLETIFFGGGTPSLWEPKELGRVLATIRERVGEVAADVEITAECNPSSLDEGRARALLDAGVNRLSVGVQSLDEERLKFLGRLHDAEGGLEAVRAALRSGARRVSGDLIYAVATEASEAKAEEAARDVAAVADLGVTHVSAYSLTIEPGTGFGDLARKGRLPIAPDDAAADAYLAVEAALESRGFVHYEVSNYAKAGAESQHNLGYWRGHDYLGLGCGAYGTLSVGGGAAVRYRNFTSPEAYVERANARASLDASVEKLDPETRLRERIMLGLRLKDGIDLDLAADDLGVLVWTEARRRAVDKLVASGRVERDGSILRVPGSARLYTDGIAIALF